MKGICLIFTFLFAININAQNTDFILSGKITDSKTGQAISNANIYLKNSKFGVKSNQNGFYKISIKQIPSCLTFSHIGYAEKQITIENSNNIINISLETQSSELNGITITPKKPENIIKGKPLYVKDYSFYNDNILLLAYKYRSLNKAELIVLKLNGDTVTSLDVNSPEKIYKDCMGYNHLIEKENGFQIYYDSTKIQLLYPSESKDYEAKLSPCVQAIYDQYYFRHFNANNQILQYFKYNFKTKKQSEFRTISDKKALRRLKDKSRLMSMDGYTESDERFEQLCFYSPLYSPLIRINDSAFIFNFVDSKIEKYTSEGVFVKEVGIEFHQKKKWRKEIFLDEITNKVYTLYREDGISTIQEINTETGMLGTAFTISKFVFIDQIKIRNGVAYFLYTEKKTAENEYKQLFAYKL
ncbi:MAG: carboxypeptidase-like regulatory domain-containing protein [Bacteroidetes bacterium]|nr:carboxypeptidase-like regulatory domain-containing protein [Bacteroidota bacterium]